MSPELADRLGRLADKLENTLHGAKIPMPESFHLAQHQVQMREVRDELVEIVRAETGEDPWLTNPMVG